LTKDDLLDRLVENALDFLLHSVQEIEAQPKYSIVHFHAAIELFLKARLLAEHWSLVVTKRRTPDWDKFVAGDFVSVSLEEAADKLDKAVKSGLSQAEFNIFKDVTKHRNKTVHFFHEAHASTQDTALVPGLAKKQLTAWYHLHRLIVGRWKNVFEPWSDKIKKADRSLREIHAFLQIVYDQRRPDIESLKSLGSTFDACPSCRFPAQEHKLDAKPYEAKCLVCDLSERCVAIECPYCNENMIISGEGFAGCPHCEDTLKPEQVADALLAPGIPVAFDGDDTLLPANCGGCDGRATVVPTELKIDTDVRAYFCCSCFDLFPAVHLCEWCSELSTGGMDAPNLSGCGVCEGRMGL